MEQVVSSSNMESDSKINFTSHSGMVADREIKYERMNTYKTDSIDQPKTKPFAADLRR